MIDAACIIAAQLLVGWLLADLLGGILHWIEDRVLSERMPLLGRMIVAPNRRHHRDPMAFAGAGMIARNGTTWAAAAVGSLIWIMFIGPSWAWLAATVGGAVSSMVHYRTHVPPPAGHPLRVLQEIGIIQSVGQHAQHHRPPSDRRYCVLTDWLNPVLDRLRVWQRAERVLALFGVRLA